MEAEAEAEAKVAPGIVAGIEGAGAVDVVVGGHDYFMVTPEAGGPAREVLFAKIDMERSPDVVRLHRLLGERLGVKWEHPNVRGRLFE